MDGTYETDGAYGAHGGAAEARNMRADSQSMRQGAPRGLRGKSPAAVPRAAGVGAEAYAELFVIALLSVDNALWDVLSKRMADGAIFENQNIALSAKYMGKNIESGNDAYPDQAISFLTQGETDMFTDIVANGCHCEDNRQAMEQKIDDIVNARRKRRMAEIASMLDSDEIQEHEREHLKAQLAEITSSICRRKR
jgi:hypothetical protein